MEKKFTSKDYAKIGVISAIIVVPLVIAYGSAGYFEDKGTVFWSDWNCDKMIEFAKTSDFNIISEDQHKQYNLDMAHCIEEP